MFSTTTIPNFFANKNVFITGGSGFIGKVLIEKLLRSCPNVKSIYLLMREKKGKTTEDRIRTITDLPLFELLKSQNPESLKKIEIIKGDIRKLNLGLSLEDHKKLITEINVIFHAAASVRFDDSLTDAILTNTRGTREVVNLALQMEKLEVLVHVSTTYCHSEHKIIEEKFYPPHADWKKCIQIAENVDRHTLNILTEKFIHPLPNTYTFTKSLSEQVINNLCSGKIPTVIYRPSIVTNSFKDPIPGWVDSFNGPVGLGVGAATGLVRTVYGDPSVITDYIPVDFIVKALIISAWKQATYNDTTQKFKPSVYNGSNNDTIPVGIQMSINKTIELCVESPLQTIFWYPRTTVTRCYYNYFIQVLLYHLLPAFLGDTVLKIVGKKPMLMKLHRRIYIATTALAYFTHNQWNFLNANTINLEKNLHPSDLEAFAFKSEEVDLETFSRIIFKGFKKFLLKEDGADLEKVKKNLNRMWFLAQFVNVLYYLGVLWFIFVKLDIIAVVINTLNKGCMYV